MTHDELIEKIKVLNLKEGDVLCLTSPHCLSEEAWQGLREDLADVFKINTHRVILLEDGMDLKVIRSEALKAELAMQTNENEKYGTKIKRPAPWPDPPRK